MVGLREEESIMQQSIGEGSIAIKMIKRVRHDTKFPDTGISCIQYYDVARIEVEDDNTYTIVIEETK